VDKGGGGSGAARPCALGVPGSNAGEVGATLALNEDVRGGAFADGVGSGGSAFAPVVWSMPIRRMQFSDAIGLL